MQLNHLEENQAISSQLVFTDSAANKVKQLIEEEGNSNLKLRVFVKKRT